MGHPLPRHVPISPAPALPFAARIAALQEAFSGRLGFYGERLTDGESVQLRADEPFPTASVIKVAVCAAVLDLVARGEVELGQAVTLPPTGQRVAGTGILKQLELDSVSLRDAIELAITLSDNVATNALLALCETERVNSYLAKLGLQQTRIRGPVDFARWGAGLQAGMGVSTPREQAELFAKLHRERILTPALCRYLVGVLGRQHYLEQIPRWLGFDPYAQYHGRTQPLMVANKTGELDGIRTDAALLMHSERGTVAAAVFTVDGLDRRETVDVEGALAVAECGAAIAACLLGLEV